MGARKSTQEFVDDAKKVHGNRYDYSKVNYVRAIDKVCIICRKHGPFYQKPFVHLNGANCPECSGVKRWSTEEYIDKLRKVHGEKYNYSKVIYKTANERICVICPKHGEFWPTASNHLHGQGCESCYREKQKSTTELFIKKAKELYGNSYDYSKVEYKGNKEKVCVICPEHGEFWVRPNGHLRGTRCPGCYGTPKKTTAQFIVEAKKTHGDFYDYSKVVYDGNTKKVCIICPEHGEFWQMPYPHLKGAKCPHCSHVAKITQNSFIERSKIIHKDKFDYSKCNFVRSNIKVCIICPEHGEYWQKPSIHLRGYGCPICGGSKRLTTNEFVAKAKLVHKDRYDYSKVEYVNTSTKVCIICPEHGEFMQTPNNHLQGVGCPACPESQLEESMRAFLTKNDIIFEAEKTFDWLTYRKKMFLDFFLPDYGVAIECQGRQHFGPSDYYGGIDAFEDLKKRDKEKKILCEKHGIKIIYYSNLGINYPYDVTEDLSVILLAIKNRGIIDSKYWKDPELPFID